MKAFLKNEALSVEVSSLITVVYWCWCIPDVRLAVKCELAGLG